MEKLTKTSGENNSAMEYISFRSLNRGSKSQTVKVRKTIQRSLILLLDILVFINCVRAQLIITSLVGIRIA